MPGEAALNSCDTIGMKKFACGSPVQDSRRGTQRSLASLSRVSLTHLLDGGSNPSACGPVPEPGPGAELHSFLRTLNIRHKSLLDRYLHDFVAEKPRGERQCDQRLGGPGISR